MKEILSTKNEYIKHLKKLNTRKSRKEAGVFLADGEKCVSEALEYADVEAVLTTEPDKYDFDNTILVSRAVIEAVSDTKTPQSSVAVVRLSQNKELPENGLAVILEDVSDPQNVGAIIRIADAAGAAAVIVSPASADPFSQKSVRASMGSVFHVPIIEMDTLDAVKNLSDNGFSVIATHLNGSEELPCVKNAAIIIGNEARGISNEAAAAADHLYKIKMYGKAESLNASVAAGIVMFRIADKIN